MSERVPKAMQAKYDEITALTDAFCQDHLNEEYAALARKLTAALARKRPSPLNSGQVNSWACGIVYALGQVNFLFDQYQEPHIPAADLCALFGVASSTGGNKAKTIRDALKIRLFDSDWTLPSKIDANPMTWLISVNGYILDARYVSREIQEEAYRRGYIRTFLASRRTPHLNMPV
ncbi:MAG: hypothetical protein JW910_02990 [Anaerolineae bacterium]|nr:hypothetical protein [Anaerolineae bacterium]